MWSQKHVDLDYSGLLLLVVWHPGDCGAGYSKGGGWEMTRMRYCCASASQDCSPEGQPYPGLHQKKHGQQVERGDSPPLLCSCETLP